MAVSLLTFNPLVLGSIDFNSCSVGFVHITLTFYGVHLGAWNSLLGAADPGPGECFATLYDSVPLLNKTDHVNIHSTVFVLLGL